MRTNAAVRTLLETLDPSARDQPSQRSDLRPGRPLRDRLAADALQDQNGQGWADIIDFLTMWPDARRRVARLLGEIEAS